MKNRIFAVVSLLLFSFFALSSSVVADVEQDVVPVFSHRIVDSAELALLQAQDTDAPEGYQLVEVIETYFPVTGNNILDSDDNFYNKLHEHYQPLLWDTWEARNLQKDSYDIIYPNSPLVSDYFEGPANFTQTYTQTASAEFTSSTGISGNIVAAKLDIGVGYSNTFTRSFEVSAKLNEIVNVKVFASYNQWRYDAYKNGSFMGEEFVHKPIGLAFRQYRYAK